MSKKHQDLHQAIIENDEDTARKLILGEADVDALNSDGWSPLHLCAQTDNQTIAKLLVNAGAKVNTKNAKGITPLHSSSWANTIHIAKLLIQHGANVNTKDNLQWNPLMMAAWSNHDALIDMYIQNGASINARNRNGSTALHLAAYNNCPLAVSRLIEHKANVNVQNNDGMTALDIANKRNNKDCEHSLLRANSRSRAPESAPTTPVKVSKQHYIGTQSPATFGSELQPELQPEQPKSNSTHVPTNNNYVQQPSNEKKIVKSPDELSPSELSSTKQVNQADQVTQVNAEQQGAYFRDTFFLLDKPEQDMPFLTELTKEQAKLSSDGSQFQPVFPKQLVNVSLSGDKMRRKSEVVIANLLYSLDLNYVYERKLCGTVAVGINYPAFTIFCPDDSIIVWEHVSALETPEKKQQFNLLKRWYKLSGFFEGKNFFVTQDNEQGGVDSQSIWEVAEKINDLVEKSANSTEEKEVG